MIIFIHNNMYFPQLCQKKISLIFLSFIICIKYIAYRMNVILMQIVVITYNLKT